MVVQTDEFIQLGFPLESVDAVVEVDRELATFRDLTQPLSEEGKNTLCSWLQNWTPKSL
jgi:hypothetical protein